MLKFDSAKNNTQASYKPKRFEVRKDANTSNISFPVSPAEATMTETKDEANAKLAAAVKKLGAGYRARSWPVWVGLRGRGPIPSRVPGQMPAGAAAAAAAAGGDDVDSVAASALAKGYPYRRPVPLPDEHDDMAMEVQDAQKESAVLELEAGLTDAADGPPFKGGDDGGAAGGGDGDGVDDGADDELYTADSTSSVDTEEAVAFALDWDDEDGDGAGGPQDTAGKLASSQDPASFQGAKESARSLLTMGAYFGSTAKAMFGEHKRARKEADMYMSEVSNATGKLPISISAVF